MAGEMVIAGIPNVLDGGLAMIGQGAGVGVAGGDHADQEPSSLSIAAGPLPKQATFSISARKIVPIDFVSIINHNLDRARGSYWRAWSMPCSENEPEPYAATNFLEYMYPTGSAVTGTIYDHTDVDDNPWLAASEADGMFGTFGTFTARFDFATPAQGLSQVTNGQAFVLRVDGPSETFGGVLGVKLYEGGVLLAELFPTTYVGGGANDPLNRKVIILPWSASLLSDPSGANVQVEVYGSSMLWLFSVLWVAAYSVADVVPENVGDDSGWMLADAPEEPAAFGGQSPELTNGPAWQQTDLYILPTPFSPTALFVDAAPRVLVSMLTADPSDDPRPHLGVLAAGTAWRPNSQVGNFIGLSLGVRDTSKVSPVYGGQQLPSSRARMRTATFTLPRLTREQTAQLLERIDWRKGIVGAWLVSFYPEDEIMRPISTFWCRLDEAALAPFVLSGVTVAGEAGEPAYRFDKTYSIVEKR